MQYHVVVFSKTSLQAQLTKLVNAWTQELRLPKAKCKCSIGSYKSETRFKLRRWLECQGWICRNLKRLTRQMRLMLKKKIQPGLRTDSSLSQLLIQARRTLDQFRRKRREPETLQRRGIDRVIKMETTTRNLESYQRRILGLFEEFGLKLGSIKMNQARWLRQAKSLTFRL